MLKLKFVSYDGRYPSLCSGTLTIKDETFGRFYRLTNVLKSGGKCSAHTGGRRSTGPWRIYKDELPKELVPYIKDIQKLVNDNVEHGCCGGCS